VHTIKQEDAQMTINEVMESRLDGIILNHTADVKIEQTGTEKGDPSYRIDMKVDFTGWTVKQVLEVALRSLVISRQRVWRKMKKDELLKESGKTLFASEMGKAPKAQVDVQAAFMARFAAATPEEQAKMIAELQATAAGK